MLYFLKDAGVQVELGKILIYVGLFVAAVGVLVYFFHDKLHWFGHLPGDIAIERENFKFYFPLTTLLLINAVIWCLVQFWNKMKS